MNYKSQFGYILDLLEISGKELSSLINVDRTLVSKWKNNARPLKEKNPHFDNIRKSLIAFNKKRGDAVLERFFREIYPKVDRNEPDYLETCLHLWLVGENLGYFSSFNDWRRSKSSLYSTTIDVYKGNQGKRDAVMEFFKYALELPAGQEIYISDTESFEWITEDMSYYKSYHEKLNELALKGHNIIILYDMNHAPKTVSAFDYFRLSKYFTGKVTAYGLDASFVLSPSLYIVHKQMSLISIENNHKDDKYIAVYRDPFSIEQAVKDFSNRLGISKKLISSYSSHGTSLKGFTETLMTAIQDRNISYFLSPLPPFSTMPDELLKSILEQNDLSDQQIYELMQIHKVNKKLFFKEGTSAQVEEILSQSHLLQALKLKKVKLQDMSTIVGKDIFITQQELIEHLNHLRELDENHDYFNVTVAAYNDLPLLSSSMIWLIEDQVMYSYPLSDETNFIISDSKFILDKASDFIHTLLMLNEDAKPLEAYIKKRS